MPRFAANLSTLFTEVPFLERFALAKSAGFSAVECQFPYSAEVADIIAALAENDLQMVLHNMPPGDWDAGERGIAILPGREDEFRAGVVRAVDYAGALGCRQINCLSGIEPEDADSSTLRTTFAENLKFAADALEKADIRLLVEPINAIDVPGFFLHRLEMAQELIEDVGSGNLFIQYDLYHRARGGGELIESFLQFKNHISHIQIADVPGRHEPGTGQIDFPAVFATLDAEGYGGWVGCEYFPEAATVEGLGWMESHLPL